MEYDVHPHPLRVRILPLQIQCGELQNPSWLELDPGVRLPSLFLEVGYQRCLQLALDPIAC